MEFGISNFDGHIGYKLASTLEAAGFDYLEDNVQSLLRGDVKDDAWTGMEDTADCGLPIAVANCLIPAALKVVGPTADLAALESYLNTVLLRARRIGITTLVFGSGGARQVPEGFARETAVEQIVDFLKMAGPLAQQHGVTLVVEPLNKGETNIINTVAEAMDVVLAVGHPAVRGLLDSYHFWMEKEELQNVEDAAAALGHVHVADLAGRVAPGESGPEAAAMYRAFFGALKRGGYKGCISVEGAWPTDLALGGKRVVTFLKEQWEQA